MREIKFRAWTGTHILPVENLDWADDGLRPYINETTWANPNTLMQYTGLRDKNGVEVYEGDLLKARHTIAPAIWDGWGWEAENPQDSEDYIVITDPSSFEVIGNIYENPDLLAPQEPTV